MANVSTTTISRYINGKYEYMSEDTKNKITQIINKYQFQPSNIARSLKNKSTKLIGVVISDIENPFSAPTIKSMNQCILESNLHMIVSSANNSLTQENKIVDSLVAQRVDAILINPVSCENKYLFEINKQIPIILLDRNLNDSNLDIIYSENIKSVNLILDHLFEEGYKNVYLFTEDYSLISTRKDRLDTFIKYLNKKKIKNSQDYVCLINKYDDLGIENKIKDIIKKNNTPSVIFATNGPTLMKVAYIIKKLGLKMPHEIGLCGYDDFGSLTEMGWAQLNSVSLTTLAPNWVSLGKMAIKATIKRVSNPNLSVQKIPIDVPLFKRDSTNLKNFS